MKSFSIFLLLAFSGTFTDCFMRIPSSFIFLRPNSMPALHLVPESEDKHVGTVLFVECGFGADAHGQNATKAALRACRNAIEFNQIPSIADIVPGGRNAMKLDVLLAVPQQYQDGLDLESIRKVFPYGKVHFQIQAGGMVASHGKMIESLGDKNEDMIITCVAVTVGY